MPAIQLLLVDDNPAMLEMLVDMLQRDFVIAGIYSDGATVLAQGASLNADIIVLDISLGDMTGFYVAKRLHDAGCRAKIVFLSVHETPDFIRAAFEIGALGYVFKSQVTPDLIHALHAAYRGEHYVPGGVTL